MSLRTRIVAWFAVTTTIIIFILAFTTHHILVASLHADLDERLRLHAEVVATAISSAYASGSTNYAPELQQIADYQLAAIPLLMRVSDLQGNVVARLGDIPQSIVPVLDEQLTQPGTDKGRFDNISVSGVETLRVYTVQVRDPSTQQPFARIQTGESLAPVDAAENRLLRYAVTEGLVGSLATILVGLFIQRRGFRPLDRILARVQRIKDTDLTAGLSPERRPPELQQLADSLNAMWQRLDAALRAKEAFVASVSHELRTPLTAIQGQIDVLLMRPSADSEVRESLERTAREVRRLVRMTNNLLLNAQLDSRPALAMQQVNLRELLSEVVKEVRVLAGGLDLELLAGEDIVVPGDYDLLKQMVLNLVDNAIKFTPKGGHIRLALSYEEQRAVFSVSDSGQGIPPEHLPHVMEPFYRVNISGRSRRGIGLGLAIVKQVVELHGGEIRIDSREGGGTTVGIYLPLQMSPGPAESVA